MLGTPGIEVGGTARALVATAQVLVDGQLTPTVSAEHGLFMSLMLWPNLWEVSGQCLMTADAGIVLAATFMLDCDDVQVGVPMGALGGGRYVYAVDDRMLWMGGGISH